MGTTVRLTNMKELIALIGKTGYLRESGFEFPVTVTDVKSVYGTDRLEVSPVGGNGSAWVNADRVRVSA
jgi:hypothetical protein